MLSTMSSSTVCFNNEEIVAQWKLIRTLIKKTPLFVHILHHLAGENAEVYD